MIFLWEFALLGCVLLLFTLPMLPAIMELRRKEDAQPLRVVREHDGKITYFATSFREMMRSQLPPTEADRFEGTVDSTLVNGDPCRFVVGNGVPVFSKTEVSEKSTRKLMVGFVPLSLPRGLFFEAEVYAVGGIAGGSWNGFRAFLSEGDALLGEGTDVIRWAHAVGRIEFGRGSRLYGRVSSDTEIRLHRQTGFARIQAPVLRFGGNDVASLAESTPAERNALAMPPRLLDAGAGRWLINGSFNVPANSSHAGNLVVRKTMTIGHGSCIEGDLKSGADLRIEHDTLVFGAVVARNNLHIGRHCRIKGPVVAEGTLTLAPGCVVGTPDMPTTITATEVRITEGAIVHGAVWPRVKGLVVKAPASGETKQ